MKWIKVAIGAVIAIVSLGIVATSVYGITRETMKHEVITFEILTETTITGGIFDTLFNYGDSIYIPLEVNNGQVFSDIVFLENEIEFITLRNELDGTQFVINPNDTFDDYDMIGVSIGDTFELTFEVSQQPQLTGVTATLILLAPLIFVGGVLAYLMYKQDY